MRMSETEAKDQMLEHSLIASELRVHEREILHKLLGVEHFSAGESITASASIRGDALLILASGQIKVSALVDEEYVSFTLQEIGDIARIASFVGTPVTRVDARIDALTDTTLLTLQRYQVEALLYQHPQLVYYLMRGLTRYAHQVARRSQVRGDEISRLVAG